jgi:serine protease
MKMPMIADPKSRTASAIRSRTGRIPRRFVDRPSWKQASILSLLLVLLSSTVLLSCQAQTTIITDEESSTPEPTIRVLVGFESLEDQQAYWQSTISDRAYSEDRHKLYRYQRSPAVAITIPETQLEALRQDPRVSYVERDQTFVLYQTTSGSEVLPYGIQAVQGASDAVPPPLALESNCQNPDSFKVCVVDSGLLIDHNDIPYESFSSSNVRGEIFGISNNLNWYQPSAASSHGTHVTGTILAQANNGVGVVGIVPNAGSEGICLLVARTFDERGFQEASFITQAVEWCADQGAKVINMSLGSTITLSNADQQVYNRLWEDENVLIVAAAGNSGTSQFSFPASLESVVSVAATDQALERARFSQFNSQVNLAAPGVNILSTITSNALLVNPLNILMDAALMQLSPDTPDEFLAGDNPLRLIDCGQGFAPCGPNAQDRACLIERGSTFFWEKALNCQVANGVAVFVYNNVPGAFGGSLSEENVGVRIPTYAMSREDGLTLLEQQRQQPDVTSVALQPASASYGFLDGTSMATPHVAGVATKIWAARPACSNRQIRQALEASALDLGSNGRDDEYGFGLVQAEAAFDYIVSRFDPPCGGVLEEQPIAPPTRDCVETFNTCSQDADCCSNRCVASSFQGLLACRSVPKAAKNKISGDAGRGGAASGGGRFLEEQEGSAVAGRSSNRPRRIRGASNVNKKELISEEPRREERVADAKDEAYHHHATTGGPLPPFQDLNCPFAHRTRTLADAGQGSPSILRSLEGVVAK